MTPTICIFDAYGTLFDVSAAARSAAREPGREALAEIQDELSADWRSKQLSYTWLRAAMGVHADFWQVTQDGLDWALANQGLDGDRELRHRLLALYWELEAFDEVPQALRDVKAAGRTAAILSNGTPEMLEAAVATAGIGAHLDAVLSVEAVGVFKPAAKVYDMVGARFGCPREAVLFVSSNGWDAAAAAAYGFKAVWVNRTGAPMDNLPGRPHHVIPDLSTIAEIANG